MTLDNFDFSAVTINRVKNKPKEKTMKIFATHKQKEEDLKLTQAKDETESKPKLATENKSEKPAEFEMESLF
jgi:hypothetical protein